MNHRPSQESRRDSPVTDSGETTGAADKIALLDSLVGIVPPDNSDIRGERLSRQSALDEQSRYSS